MTAQVIDLGHLGEDHEDDLIPLITKALDLQMELVKMRDDLEEHVADDFSSRLHLSVEHWLIDLREMVRELVLLGHTPR